MTGRGGLDDKRVRHLLRNYPRYQLGRILGNGTFGTVAQATDTAKCRQVALKFVEGGAKMRNLEREVLNHRALHHPHIIEYKKCFAVPGYLVIVMEHANGGDLFDFVASRGRLSENDARTMFQQLILAVDYCHKRRVASRDIKCENLLLQYHEGRSKCPLLKLCDFGYSCMEHVQSDPTSMVGSLDYMAPEVINNIDRLNYDAAKYDIWSCGVVLYVMLIGEYPFSPRDIPSGDVRYQEIVRSRVRDLNYRLPNYLSAGALDLIKGCLSRVHGRITMDKIIEHPWFQKRLPSAALNMNKQLLETDSEIMRQVENRQSAAEIKEIIQKVRLGEAPSSVNFEDAFIDQIIEGELNAEMS